MALWKIAATVFKRLLASMSMKVQLCDVPINGKMHAPARRIHQSDVQLMASGTDGHILMVPLQQWSTNVQDPTDATPGFTS